ncbi:MAG: fasciclin domain-containing protein [Azospirillaceae bacterium]
MKISFKRHGRPMLVAAGALALAACQTGMANMSDDDMMAMDGTVMVGGEAMFPDQTIVANAVNSADHTTLVAAVQAADLVDTLNSPGPFTVFAPVNDAFEDLPAGTVETLLRPQNKDQLTAVLTYHVVPGTLDSQALMQRIRSGGGSATLETANGGTLMVAMNGPSNVVVTDASGNTANIGTYDVYQSNGVIHSIDTVLLP